MNIGYGVIVIFPFKKKEKIQQHNVEDDKIKQQIPLKISQCQELVQSIFGSSSDMIIDIFETSKEEAMIVYIDGMVNKDLIDRDIIKPLKSNNFDGNVSLALKSVYKEINDISLFVEQVLNGYAAVFYGNSGNILLVEFRDWNQRSVEEPNAEAVIRGPKEGFTESIRTNTALIRRKIKTRKLVIENLILGRLTKTAVELVYIEGIVNQDVLKELKYRLSKIDIDIILESGNIEQYIEEKPYSPISGIGVTQKPDVVAQRIAEGRVAIVCDGTPHVLTVPELFVENLFSSEDYYNRVVFSTIMRVLRIIGLFISIILPGLAVAVLTYHHEMMPSVFLTNVISASQKTPMPMAAEVFFLTLMFELLKEAGTRLPKAIGSAITIVGSLIVGDAAVNAGIVSAPMVIIVALTAVTSFIMPNLAEFSLVYKGVFWFFGSIMGLIGIGTAIFIMLTQLISTESFGIPILSSSSKNEMKDSVVRFPLWAMKYRPSSIAKENVKRKA
ncbi:MAG: spore germination protein [Eubacteriales bacterium]